MLSGRAAEPGAIEARTPREAGLIDAVRKEGRRDLAALNRSLREEDALRARRMERVSAFALASAVDRADERLKDLHPPSGTPPCAASRTAVVACLAKRDTTAPVDGSTAIACANEVTAFSECARQLARLA